MTLDYAFEDSKGRKWECGLTGSAFRRPIDIYQKTLILNFTCEELQSGVMDRFDIKLDFEPSQLNTIESVLRDRVYHE